MTRIDVTATVPVATANLDAPERFLPAPARPAGPDRWVVDFVVGPFHHEAVVELGPVWRTEDRVGRAIAWRASVEDHDALPYELLTPPVHGVVVLEGNRLSLRVDYTPRAGMLGRALDVALRRVGRGSVHRFLDAIAERMGRPAPTGTGGV